ncbi:Na+/H+ antiporter NhaC family protein [Desulfitobacterium chlororespirans]|uniref:Transporter, NhaC family n=1 Tax=Desulfitobacterium chlororespirans DSM 11544 TaxID=1121395 RepID=A0A1M7UBS5_9FIRM|nr:Na+/H+ antiporter NhaC family protein [Desulfitobacterium chlororespirans]SHN80404.1 transporter, NhaC family [Desulfitobacterium chlororespirans DSM 11544]
MDSKELEFRGGQAMATIPIAIFLVFCALFFMVFRVFDMTALAMCAFIAIIIGGVFAKNYQHYWNAVILEGIGSPMAVTIAAILLVISMFAKLMAKSGVAEGFAWLANTFGLHGGLFTVFAFVSCCVIAASTGTSIGTLFTGFPVFFSAGILLGANPVVLASAILSGAIFGDNIAPISDTTVASASTQNYSRREGSAEISGVVSTRFRFALAAAILAAILFFIFGGGGQVQTGAEAALTSMNPKGLIMLIAVVILLVVAFKTRDIFKAIPIGIVVGTVVGLVSGVFTWDSVFSIQDGAIGGFLFEGFSGMVSTVLFVLSLFGIMGILKASNTMDRIAAFICDSKMAQSVKGAEFSIAAGTIVATALVGGVTSASILTFGPVANEIGKRKHLHPFRRAVLVDCFSMTIGAIIPFLSAFIFISSSVINSLRSEYQFIPTISPVDIALTSFYPLCLFVVLIYAVITGWGRKFEGPNGSEVKTLEN